MRPAAYQARSPARARRGYAPLAPLAGIAEPEPRLAAPESVRRAPGLVDGDAALAASALVILACFAAMVSAPSGPEPFRALLTLLALVLLPGLGLARFLLAEREAEWPEWLASSMGLGLACHAALALAAQLLGVDPAFELWALPVLGVALLAASSVSRGASRSSAPSSGAGAGAEKGRTLAWLVTALAAAATVAWVSALGPPLGLLTDAPDHLATVRRLAMEGRVLVPDAFHSFDPTAAFDPRKGIYHSLLALVARAGDLDPVSAWRWATVFLAPLLVLASYCLARRVAHSRAAGALAALLVGVAYGGGAGISALREAAYPMRVADSLALLVAWAGLAALSSPGWRRVALAAGFAFAAVTTHLFAAVQAAFFLLATVVGALVGYPHLPLNVLFRSKTAWLRRAALLGSALALACLPYALYRMALAGGTHDPLHTEAQGLLYWWGQSAFTVDPRQVAAIWGWPALALLCALPLVWRRRHEGLGPVYLAAATVLALGIALNPFVLPLAQGVVGYLVFRFLSCVPLVPALAVAAVLGVRAFSRPASPVSRKLAALALVGLVIGLWWPARQAVVTLAAGPERAGGELYPAADQKTLLEALRRRWSEPRVLLADPLTSYAIPAWTGHRVVTGLDQHGTPVDARGPERRQSAREALSPYVGMRRTLQALRREQVDAVVLNTSYREAFSYQGGAWLPELQPAIRDKFQSHPEYFSAARLSPEAWVFELTERARSGPLPDPGDPPLPYAQPAASARLALVPESAGEAFEPLGARIEPRRAAPGESLHVSTLWRRQGDRSAPYGFYVVACVLETDPPRSALYHRAYAKLYRQIVERVTGARWRMLAFHLPARGLVSPDEWPAGEIVEDRFSFPVQERAGPGSYRLRVRMVRVPPYPNARLSDLFEDDDRLSGPVVGTVEIAPRATASR